MSAQLNKGVCIMREMEINGEKWIPQSESNVEVATIENGNSVSQKYVGKFVIVRTRNEGINAGTVIACDETGVELKECRRIWYHKAQKQGLVLV